MLTYYTLHVRYHLSVKQLINAEKGVILPIVVVKLICIENMSFSNVENSEHNLGCTMTRIFTCETLKQKHIWESLVNMLF